MKRLVLALLLVGATARAQSPALDEAKREYQSGATAYDLSRYEDSLRHFERAYELSKLPPILFNLGQAHRRLYETGGALDHLRRAREMYGSYLRLVPISPERAIVEELHKGVEAEYARQLHARRDKLLVEAHGAGALSLAEDFLAQGDGDAAQAALDRFQRSPGNQRGEVARAFRLRARLAAAHGEGAPAVEAFASALELDPGTAAPPDSESAAVEAFGRARARSRGQRALTLQHVPPSRLRIGQAVSLQLGVVGDPQHLVDHLEVAYRAGGGAFATLSAAPGTIALPAAFNSTLQPGARIEYWVAALDGDGALLDTLGSPALPFALAVDARPARPVYRRWQFWVGLAAGALVVGGVAAAVGITQAPPERFQIGVTTGALPK